MKVKKLKLPLFVTIAGNYEGVSVHLKLSSEISVDYSYVLSSFITRGSSVGWRPRRKGWTAVHIRLALIGVILHFKAYVETVDNIRHKNGIPKIKSS